MTDTAKPDEAAPILTVCVLIVSMLALTFVDRALAKAERSEKYTDAARFYTTGQRLMREGQSATAVEKFRSAVSEQPEDRDYQLALGEALAASGQTGDAEAMLNTVLENNPAWA